MAQFPALDSLIAQFEGFGTPGAPSITAGNNPGAIEYGPYAIAQGATGRMSNGVAAFPDLATGESALDKLLGIKIGQGYNTPASLAGVYAPANAPGNTQSSTDNYAQYIANGLGIGTNDTITPGGGSEVAASALDKLLTFDPNETLIPGYKSAKDAVGGTVSTGTKAVSFLSGLSLAQIVAAVIGIGLIIGGVFFLRPVQQATTTVIRTGQHAARLLSA